MTERHVVVVWCLPGMTTARLVVVDDRTDKVAARSLDLGQLESVRAGLDEAIRRVGEALR